MASRNSLHSISEFLAHKRIALVGVSRNSHDFTRTLFREFLKHGCDVIPVNPAVEDIEGRRCYPSVKAIVPLVSAVLILTPASVTEGVVAECIAAGVKQVWLYRGGGTGAVTDSAVTLCRENRVDVVVGECPFMFLPNTGFPHRVHGFIRKICGSYPA